MIRRRLRRRARSSSAHSSVAIAYRLAFQDHSAFPALILLPLAVAAPILFALVSPRVPGR